MPPQYVNLMPEDQDLGHKRRSRPEQPDQHRPNKAAGFLHKTERLRDSASVVSPDSVYDRDKDLSYQRSSRPEQPDQRRPNKAASFPHRTEGLRDSASQGNGPGGYWLETEAVLCAYCRSQG